MAPLLQAMALALRASAPTCPAAPTCPQDDQCMYSSNGVALQVSCATDYYGGDLQLVQSATLADCLQACAATSQCVAVSYTGQNCYMKSTLEAARSDANVIGGAVISRATVTTSTVTSTATSTSTSAASSAPVASAAPTACPATYTCPENNGCTLSGSNSQTYILTCGTDYYGGDLTSMSSNSLQDCTTACANNSQCVAASYVGGKGAGTCYLKSSNQGPSTNSNVDSIAIYTPAAPASPSASSAASTSSVAASSSTLSATSSSAAGVSSSLSTPSSTPLPTTSTAARLSSTSTPTSSAASTPASTRISTPASTRISTPASTPVATSVSTSAPAPTQVIVNGGFESADMSSWSIGGAGYASSGTGRVSVNPRTGKYSFQAQGLIFGLTPFSVTLSQTVTVVPGKSYNLALSTKQTVPTCVFSGFYNEFPIFANVKLTDNNYATTTAKIAGLMTNSKSGVLRISATGCLGTSLWLDDISLTQA